MLGRNLHDARLSVRQNVTAARRAGEESRRGRPVGCRLTNPTKLGVERQEQLRRWRRPVSLCARLLQRLRLARRRPTATWADRSTGAALDAGWAEGMDLDQFKQRVPRTHGSGSHFE